LAVEPASGKRDVSVARVVGFGSEGGRKILEAAQVGELRVEWRTEARSLDGLSMVRADQPLGAIAAYLCEPESDDGAIENGLVGVPAVDDDFPIWRV
jgi:hypothetical protein